MVDRDLQRPKEQWWLQLRPIARILAQPAPRVDPVLEDAPETVVL